MITILVLLFKIVCLFLLDITDITVSGLTCLSCREITQPRHCHTAVTCPAAHFCGTDRVLTQAGTVAYNVGCRHKAISAAYRNHTGVASQSFSPCLECCEDTLCNANTCGQPDYPPVRGPLCYQCENYRNVTECSHIAQCATDEVCYVEKSREYSDLLYSSGCKMAQSCSNKDSTPLPAQPVGRRFLESHLDSPLCVHCCHRDLCNTNCGHVSHIDPGCTDQNSCSYLMRHYDVCSDATLRQDCPLSCGLCGPTCTTVVVSLCSDDYGNCAYLQQSYSICDSSDTATKAGCRETCGVCGHTHATTATTVRSTTSAKTSTTSTSTTATLATTHSPPIWPPNTGPHDCRDVYESGQHTSGVYSVNVSVKGQLNHILVYCDMDTPGGGWTVMQRRYNGSVDFYRNSHEYDTGFGNVDGELWFGLKWVYWMTVGRPSQLFINMTEADRGQETFIMFDRFSLGSPPNYTLHLSPGTGSARTGQLATQSHNGQAFSTKDQDMDAYFRGNCARLKHAGCWYQYCNTSNLNGHYGGDYNSTLPASGFYWRPNHELKTSQMAFRRMSN